MDDNQNSIGDDSVGLLQRLKQAAQDYVASYRAGDTTLDSLAWRLEDVVTELERHGVQGADELRTIWIGVETLNAVAIVSGVPADRDEMDQILLEFSEWLDGLQLRD